MVERFLLAILITLAGLMAYSWYSKRVLARRARQGLMLAEYSLGKPAILYFSSNNCAPCEKVQKPVLQVLSDAFEGRLQVIEIDAEERRHLANAWGVLSLPTTFIIDAKGRPRRVNHGLVRSSLLLRQLAIIGELPANRSGLPMPAGHEKAIPSK